MEEINKTVEIIPMNAELNTEMKFCIELLPEWLQLVSNEHAESYGTPVELWATAFLSGISAATGKRVKLTTGNYENYPQLWTIIVGASGTGKSEALGVAYRRLWEIETELHKKYNAELDEWENGGKEGARPRRMHLLVNDTTPENLYKVMEQSPNGLALMRDELSGWFDDIGRYNVSGEIGHYLSMYNNKTFSVGRKNDEPKLIEEPLFNIAGTIQPGVLGNVLSKNNSEVSGFAQRFLYLYPDFPPRKYNPKPVNPETYKLYENFINSIVAITDNHITTLSKAAETEYAAYFDELEGERARSDEFWSAAYSKAQIQVLRLALLVKIARLPEKATEFVEIEDIRCAIGMMRYFIHSLEKFKSEQGEPKRGKKEVIKDIIRANPEASQRDIAQAVGVSQPYVNRVIRLSGITSSKGSQTNGYRENIPITNEDEAGDAPDTAVISPKVPKMFAANDLSKVITDNLITDNKIDLSTLPF